MAKKITIVAKDLPEGLQREINLFCRGIIPMTEGSTMMISKHSKQEVLKTILTFCLKAQQSKRHALAGFLNSLSISKKYKKDRDLIMDLATEVEAQVEDWELEK